MQSAKQPIDRDKVWDELRQGIEQVYATKGTMAPSQYMKLYAHVWDLATRTNPKNPPNSDGDGKNRDNGVNAAGYELYGRLQKFLRSYVEGLFQDATSLVPEDVLRFYKDKWESYKLSSMVVSKIFFHLNNKWLVEEWKGGKKDVYDTCQLCVLSWKESFFEAFHSQLTRAVLKLIEDDRKGEAINAELIRCIMSSYAELGFNEQDPSDQRPNFSVYKSAFEGPFVEDTERFYNQEGAAFLEQNPVTEYIKKVEQWLAEEERRVRQYLFDSTLKPLADTCHRALIERRLEILYEEFKNLLRDDRCDDLGRMYRLVSHTDNGLVQLRELFGNHVLAEGLSTIGRIGEAGVQNPKLYVDTLLSVHRKYNTLVVTAFANEEGFVEAFDKACTDFVNKNAVTVLAKSSRKSPELLAKYCDMLLKKSAENPEETELEDVLDQVTIVFKYIDDKDVFQKFYSKMLARRLVQQLSASDDAEASMISRLKLACGIEYVWALERMFQDIAVSRDVNEQFMQHVRNSGENLGLDFSIQVLTSGSWPFSQSFDLTLPQELERSVQRFTVFYSKRHSARKLQWLCNLSRGELATNCFGNSYTLQASTFQIAVLLQYNNALSFTVQQLQEGTGMEMYILQQVLQTLLKCKLLLCADGNTAESGELPPGASVSLHQAYNHKKLRVNISVPLKAEVKADQEAIERKIDEDRKIVIQAAIVRIMKSRITLKHQELVGEVLHQLSANFKPHVPMIKQCINMLIEKEYLERDADKEDTYNYLA
ncbi:hypothetical protein HPB48_015106 [Haemaphysalis longicornis]|uniref:Cullin-1 n=1 Tax=Haemaphysalis longicornis TaxID=44386 RepID=A0A9J6G4W7_HAELO|nr:hypothetical protein HPB48_015106 [Haemaphysalis longicornis]